MNIQHPTSNAQRPIADNGHFYDLCFICNPNKNTPILYWKFDVGRWTLDVRKAFVVIKILARLNTLLEAEFIHQVLIRSTALVPNPLFGCLLTKINQNNASTYNRGIS
jgi:hypothetical protein